tara:strand:+ start:1130 stop:1309 length:180 start_codon:yes stop_codon:yes gene_type:complete
MKNTVKKCQICDKIFLIKSNIICGEYCRICSKKKQNEAESKLSEYMDNKYNKKIIGVSK